jgi:hypothetical protein
MFAYAGLLEPVNLLERGGHPDPSGIRLGALGPSLTPAPKGKSYRLACGAFKRAKRSKAPRNAGISRIPGNVVV